MKPTTAVVMIENDTLEGHLRNAQTILKLKRELGENLSEAELLAVENRLANALGCLALARELRARV